MLFGLPAGGELVKPLASGAQEDLDCLLAGFGQLPRGVRARVVCDRDEALALEDRERVFEP